MVYINAFRFDLDISNQEAIYDYVAKEELRRPADGNWDLSLFKGRGSLQQISADDENEKLRVLLMDESFIENSQLQREADHSVMKSGGHSTYDESVYRFSDPEEQAEFVPRRLLPIYKRGDIVKGQLLLSLKEPLGVRALKVKFVGQAKVKLRMYNGYGIHDDIKHEQFMEDETGLWEKGTSNLLVDSSSSACFQNLPEGMHRFAFEYRVPLDAPQSVPPLVISPYNEGHLQWFLKATIEVFEYGHITAHQGLLVQNPLDIASYPKTLQPVSHQEKLDSGFRMLCNTGKVAVGAHLNKMGHVRGEALPIRIEVQNQTKSRILSVTAQVRLVGKAKLYVSTHSFYNSIDLKTKAVKIGPIQAGISCVYNIRLPWDFSSSCADGRLLPVGHVEESKLFELKYKVEIKVKRKGLSRDIDMEIPIFVGTHDSSAV